MILRLVSRLLATVLVVLLPLVQCFYDTADLDVDGRPARGVNLGNALEAPTEGAWGMVIEDEYFGLIADAGFDLVRIPICWSAHALAEAPYTIDAEFMARVDQVVDQALAQDLLVMINMHHYDEIQRAPDEHRARYLALWRQIAEHFRRARPQLFFELLNEPNDALTAERWNVLAAEVMGVVRASNPQRQLVLGPVQWNAVAQMGMLQLPDDPHLIVTFHYYSPFEFTHQGAEWVNGSDQWLGTPWLGTSTEQQAVRADLDLAANLAAQRGWTLFLGEFGAYERAELASRVRWTHFVRTEAEARGIAWAYWEFGAGFGVYDRQNEVWRPELLAALVGP